MPLFIHPFICLWTFSLLLLPGYCESHSFLIASSFWFRGAFSPRLLRFFILFLVFLSLSVEFGFRYLLTLISPVSWVHCFFICLFAFGHRTGDLNSPTRHWTRVLSSTSREFSAYAYVLCPFSHVRLFATLWTVAHQVAPSMGFSRQYWSGLPCSLL